MTMTTDNNTELVGTYADQLRPLLPQARKANGRQEPGHPAKAASEKVDELLLEYVDRGGNMTHLSKALEGSISLAGLRRRARAANAARELDRRGVSFKMSATRGSQDVDLVQAAAAKILEAQASGQKGAYGDAVREHVVAAGVSMQAVAKELGRDYYSLWTAANSSV